MNLLVDVEIAHEITVFVFMVLCTSWISALVMRLQANSPDKFSNMVRTRKTAGFFDCNRRHLGAAAKLQSHRFF